MIKAAGQAVQSMQSKQNQGGSSSMSSDDKDMMMTNSTFHPIVSDTSAGQIKIAPSRQSRVQAFANNYADIYGQNRMWHDNNTQKQ